MLWVPTEGALISVSAAPNCRAVGGACPLTAKIYLHDLYITCFSSSFSQFLKQMVDWALKKNQVTYSVLFKESLAMVE